MDLVLGNDLAVSSLLLVLEVTTTYLTLEEVTHQEVVVHCLGDDLGNRLGRHFEVGVVLGGTGLLISKSHKTKGGLLTFLFRARRIWVTSPNWEKYSFISSS